MTSKPFRKIFGCDEPPLIAPRHVLQEELPIGQAKSVEIRSQKNPLRVLYPLVMTNITIENCHRNSGFTH